MKLTYHVLNAHLKSTLIFATIEIMTSDLQSLVFTFRKQKEKIFQLILYFVISVLTFKPTTGGKTLYRIMPKIDFV